MAGFRSCWRKMLMCGALALVLPTGCERSSPTASPPSIASQPATRPPSLLAEGYQNWSAAEAIERLEDVSLAPSAALRLCQLAEDPPAWFQPDAHEALLPRIRVVRLGSEALALGLDGGAPRKLAATVAVLPAGELVPLAPRPEVEALSRLHLSRDTEVFPHVLTAPGALLIVLPTGRAEPALVLRDEPPAWFELGEKNGFPYIRLLTIDRGRCVDIAAYRWDPYEQSFFGPASAPATWPAGARIRLDLEASKRVEPQRDDEEESPQPKDAPPPLRKPREDTREREAEPV